MRRLVFGITCALAIMTQAHLSFSQAKRYALVIGITGYSGFPQNLKLNYADDDAQMFYDFIQTPEGGQFPRLNIRLLLNQDATQRRIVEEINWLHKRVGTDDIVYIFFSGHGVVDDLGLAYFMPVNADPKLPEELGFRADRFVELLRLKINSKFMILFLDACHAGSAFNSGLAKGPSSDITAAFNKAWEEAFKGKEALSMAFLSAGSNQRSFEDPQLGHGIFTWYLVEGMKGLADRTGIGDKDGVVTAGELYRYVLDKVEAHSQNKFGITQSPTKSPEFTPSYPFAVIGVKGGTLVNKAEEARKYFSKGYELGEVGDHDGAIISYREAIRLDPNYAAAYHNLGWNLNEMGDLDGAIRSYREAIRLDPNDADPHINLGSVLYVQGNLDGALKEYREAIRLSPNDAKARYGIGNALNAKGDHDGALKEYREAIRLNPNDADPHYNFGVALGAKGDLDGAIREYREAIRLDPNDTDPHYNLGNTLYDKGDLDGAIKEYREAIRLDPNHAYAHYNLGLIYEKKGWWALAADEFDDYVRLSPKASDAEAIRQKAQALRQKANK